MEAAIKKEFDISTELVRGGGGIFEVQLDGKLIYSKAEQGRFPEDSEILDALKTKSS